MKEYIKRGLFSFAVSAFSGLTANLIIDSIVNANTRDTFISMSPEFRAMFPTPAIAAYVNVLLYGLIGFAFAFMTFLFDVNRIGLLIQWLLYFVSTAAICIGITVLLWQLHRHPQALIMTLLGYATTYVILAVVQFRKLKQDVAAINRELNSDV